MHSEESIGGIERKIRFHCLQSEFQSTVFSGISIGDVQGNDLLVRQSSVEKDLSLSIIGQFRPIVIDVFHEDLDETRIEHFMADRFASIFQIDDQRKRSPVGFVVERGLRKDLSRRVVENKRPCRIRAKGINNRPVKSVVIIRAIDLDQWLVNGRILRDRYAIRRVRTTWNVVIDIQTGREEQLNQSLLCNTHTNTSSIVSLRDDNPD